MTAADGLPCAHPEMAVSAHVIPVTHPDGGAPVRMADVWIECLTCGTRMLWACDTVGVSFDSPTVNPSGDVLTVALLDPAGEPQDRLHGGVTRSRMPEPREDFDPALVREAIGDPGRFTIRVPGEPLTAWQARAVIAASRR